MQFGAAASSAVRALLAGPAQPGRLLGVSPAAIYLATAGKPGVLAVLAHDAVRLPCGVLMPTTRAELPLTTIGPAAGAACMVGDDRVGWPGPDGPVVIGVVREWAAAQVSRGTPVPAAVRQARAELPDAQPTGIDAGLLMGLRGTVAGGTVAGGTVAGGTVAGGTVALIMDLLGRGPGLTPAGDDLLAGLLLGCLAFGLDAAGLRGAVETLAPAQTTALSAALLWHAARGQCIAEVAALTAALTGNGPAGPAVRRLLAVGHTSGAALAYGLIAAADAG